MLDPQSAAVPDAEVTVINQETGVGIKVKTTSAGTYSLPALIPGLYKVTVDAKGFRTFVTTDVNVAANQDNVADARLDLGVASEIVEVQAGAAGAEIQTTSSSLNNTYDTQFCFSFLPPQGLWNGNVMNLAILAPNNRGAAAVGLQASAELSVVPVPARIISSLTASATINAGVTGPNSTVIPDAVRNLTSSPINSAPSAGSSAGGQFALRDQDGDERVAWHRLSIQSESQLQFDRQPNRFRVQ